MPVRLAGLLGKGRRDSKKRSTRLRQRPVERGKAQVVADGQAQFAPRQVGGDGNLAGAVVPRLAVAFAVGQIDVEHVNLVVTRDDVAVAIDEERTVGRLVGRKLDRERADMK